VVLSVRPDALIVHMDETDRRQTFKLTDKSRSRWTAWLHPLITAVVVVATANHYSVDVIAGVAVVLIGEILVYLAVRLWRAGRFGRSGAAPPLAC